MTVPSLLILGTDTVLAAPATAVQLAHACLAAGFEAVIPATWGDELIAAHAMRRVQESQDPMVLCACPLVARRLADGASGLEPTLLCAASPPVATALYLRALYAPSAVQITYAGGCPGGDDDSIDVHLGAGDLMAELAAKGIDVRRQPTEFDAVLPPDRRRFFSEPGGMVSRSSLRDLSRSAALHELGPEDLVIALSQRLLERSPALIDIAPALGCVCAGATSTRDPQVARARVRDIEPPRATSPVLDHSIAIDIRKPVSVVAAPQPVEAARNEVAAADDTSSAEGPDVPLSPPIPEETAPPVSTTRVSAGAEFQPEESAQAAIAMATRRSSSGTGRAILGAMPQSRTEPGRQLPRAYVARRRSTPRSVRAFGARPSGAVKSDRGRVWWWLVVGLLAAGAGIGALSVYAGR